MTAIRVLFLHKTRDSPGLYDTQAMPISQKGGEARVEGRNRLPKSLPSILLGRFQNANTATMIIRFASLKHAMKDWDYQ